MPIFKKSKLNDDNKDFIESSSPEKEIIIDVIKIKIDRKANLKESIKNTETEKNINDKNTSLQKSNCNVESQETNKHLQYTQKEEFEESLKKSNSFDNINDKKNEDEKENKEEINKKEKEKEKEIEIEKEEEKEKEKEENKIKKEFHNKERENEKEKNKKFEINIDKKNDRYPYSLVWTSIPCITHIIPWIGHLGICKSNGIIYDFAGHCLVNENNFFFGKPYEYAFLEPKENERIKWDQSIDKVVNKFKRMNYNFFCNNCHSFCCEVLNEIKYNGKNNYGMISVWWSVVTKGKYLSCYNVFKTYVVFTVIFLGIIALILWSQLK